jgi:hypothetical protein
MSCKLKQSNFACVLYKAKIAVVCFLALILHIPLRFVGFYPKVYLKFQYEQKYLVQILGQVLHFALRVF